MMPAMDGLEVLQHFKQAELLDKIPVFLITAETSDSVMKEAYRLGVMDVISKPIIPYVVARRSSILCIRVVPRSAQTIQSGNASAGKASGTGRTYCKTESGMIETLSTAIEFRSAESGDHVRRIYEITKYILEHTELGIDIDATSIEQIALASIMHDVGKIALFQTRY
ncbi:MAG: response regulator [Enterocloster clostridioformis]